MTVIANVRLLCSLCNSQVALQDPTAPVIQTALDKELSKPADISTKDQVVANDAAESDLSHGLTILAHTLAQQGVGRKTAGGAQQVGLRFECHSAVTIACRCTECKPLCLLLPSVDKAWHGYIAYW